MRPLAIFAGVLVVGLIAIGVGFRLTDHSASAGNSSAGSRPEPLTGAAFARAANRVCGRELRESKARGLRHPKIHSLRALTRDYRLLVPLFDREAAGVLALTPPRSDAAAFGRLARNLRMSHQNAHAILHALQTRQIRRAFALSRRQDVLDERMNTESRKLGLTVCAKS